MRPLAESGLSSACAAGARVESSECSKATPPDSAMACASSLLATTACSDAFAEAFASARMCVACLCNRAASASSLDSDIW